MKKHNRLFLLTLILFLINVHVCQAARVTGDQLVLYTFKEGSGTTVNDVSGVGSALNLTVANEAAVSWIPGGGLSVNTATIIESGAASTKVIDAVKISNEISIEAWVKPANTTQGGPARIVTISVDPSYRNFTLGQQADTYDIRLRTTSTSLNGIPSVLTPSGTLTTNLAHIVYTRDASGSVKIYIDGNEEANGTIGGNCSNWDDSYNLALANELTNDRSWLGEIYLVAIYDRALTEPEVDQNFAEGAIVECNVDGDCDDSNACTDDTCVGNVCQYTNNANPCDDGLYCNGTDTCSGGSCSMHGGTLCPETECNTCQEATDSCFDPVGSACTDDGNVCTDDQCDGAGSCAHPNNNDPCDDGLFCNGSDLCGGGSCSFHTGNPCPETECNTCQEATDSCLDPVSTACTDDGNICTDDQCDGTGTCVHPTNSDPCNDGLFCNGTDTCSGGSCAIHSGNPCPETECNICQEAIDSCFDPLGSACSGDGNVCTNDQCNGAGVCTHPNNNDPCDDGLFCNGSDLCGGGSCSFHAGTPCPDTECNTCQEATDSCFDIAGTSCTDDGNVCTDNECDGAGSCAHPNNSDSCDDFIACTESDTCSGGACIGTPNNTLCSDGNGCTDDICTVGVGCSNPNNTDPCDDGIYCNGTDTCSGGSCSVHPGNPCPETECKTCQEATDNCFDIAGTWCTDDGNVCTDDECDGAGSCAHPNNNDSCDDGLFCNGNDTCSGGTCSAHAGDPCSDDNFFCTGTEYCNETIDNCASTGDPCTPLVCDDPADTCTGSTASLILLDAYGTPGTIRVALDNLEDEVSEVRFDLCDPEQHPWLTIPTGACTMTGRVPQGPGASCQITDPVPADGCLSLEILAETGNFISLGTGPIAEVGYTLLPVPPVGEFADLVLENIDVLDDLAASVDVTPQAGKVGASCQNDGGCEDKNPCTTDTCNGGVCEYSNVAGVCDDGLYCTDSDTCVSGVCTGTARDCDDGLYCTGAESCDEGSDQCLSNGDPCPGTECNTCQEATDSCFDLLSTTCTDDGNVCTDDQCNGAGVCVHSNNTDPCDDLIACTESDTCSGGACNGTPNNTLCSDGNICTDDICTVGVGCSNPNNTDPCDDGIYCNGTDTCSGGNCSAHAGDPCPGTECNICQEATDSCFDIAGTSCTDDGNVCTDDQCDGAGVCAHPNNTDPCDDGIFCNGTDTCSGGNCSAHAGDPCPGTECNTCQEATDSCFDLIGIVCTDDGNVCTDDECNGSGVCAHPKNTDPCDDGLFCTQTDECQSGQCVGSDDPCFDDGDFCNGVEYCQEEVESFLCNSTGDPCDLLLICNEAGDVCDVSDVSLIIADAFGYSGTIDIELVNSLDSVGELHVDVCAVDQRGWLHIDTDSCDTTGRSSEFSCAISDIGDGCVGVDLTTVSGAIDPGTGVIARLNYTIDVIAPLGSFSDLIPENCAILDDTAASLSVTPKPGIVGVVECIVDENCDDSNVCTDDTCAGNICQHSNNTDSCNDGLFCNGVDTCSGGGCSVHSGYPCPPGTNCNEGTNSCDSTPVTSTTTSINSTTTTTISECESDADCDDDELFCNGDEICVEGECQHAGDPCPESTTCFEETEECRFTEVCAISIAPETTALVSEQFLNFTITTTGDCGDSDYEWSVQSEIGSTTDQNGNFVAGINTDCLQEVTDQIEVIDSANDVSGEAIVTISCDRIKEVINISNPLWVFYPNDIYSSHWLPTPHVLLIFAEQGSFDPRSSLIFEPVGSVTTLFNLGRKNIMIALVLVGPNAQEGPYRASVTTGSHMVTKKEALMMHIMPWILDGESNY